MITTPDYQALLQTAIAEARQGLAEGGVPIGAALYHNDGRLLGLFARFRIHGLARPIDLDGRTRGLLGRVPGLAPLQHPGGERVALGVGGEVELADPVADHHQRVAPA